VSSCSNNIKRGKTYYTGFIQTRLSKVLEETDELATIFTCDSPGRYFGDFSVFNDNFVVFLKN
jgi:hypothetical protein